MIGYAELECSVGLTPAQQRAGRELVARGGADNGGERRGDVDERLRRRLFSCARTCQGLAGGSGGRRGLAAEDIALLPQDV